MAGTEELPAFEVAADEAPLISKSSLKHGQKLDSVCSLTPAAQISSPR